MGKHDSTLAKIFHEPPLPSIPWKDIVSLFEKHGAEITQGSGSRVHVVLNDVTGSFHRPHPRKETDKGCVVSVRTFLENAGVTPWSN